MTAAPNRRWFRFRLRTLFAVVTVVGLASGWWAWNVRVASHRHLLLDSIDERGIIHSMRYTADSSPMVWVEGLLFGEKSFIEIDLIDGTFNDNDVRQLRAWFPESELWRMSRDIRADRPAVGWRERIEKL